MKKLAIILLVIAFPMLGDTSGETLQALERGFQQPPSETSPWCYWYWISDNISREGITKDLEAMARVGIGEALIGNIFLSNVPAGDVKVFSDTWWALVEHAIREGGRVGVNVGMFNCPGWSQSGGPWIKPEQAMRYLVSSETRVRGPVRFEQRLPVPKDPFQDVAVIAFPAPAGDASVLPGTPTSGGVHVFESREPFTARGLSLTPTSVPWKAKAVLSVQGANGKLRELKTFAFDRSNMAVGVGPMPQGPVTVSFPKTTSRRFELRFQNAPAKTALAKAELHTGARLESYVEKQLGKMHPTPLPMWDDYKWPIPDEPDDLKLVVSPDDIVKLDDSLSVDGTLTWDVPSGDWVIQRIGMTPTGTRNSPASPEAQGLEVDKMNRGLAEYHFDHFIGQILKRLPKDERGAFTRVVADSYEMGSQNWTDGLQKTFQDTYGYDPIPWLTVLQGRMVGSAERSERFLWDLRRLVADRIATEYVGGMSAISRSHGLGLWLENYGHWGFPGEFLKYGSRSDRIGGEYWVTGNLGSIECRAASSCANTYGKRFVSAEAFTGGPPFKNGPADLKARGDWSFCEGVNHFVLHVYIHQPWEDRQPGVNAWFGTEFNRHNTWFEQSRTWIDYLRRCCWMLQQGTRVADVAYFIGEDTPAMTGVRRPALPEGADFDYINAEVIERDLTVENGLLRLPHGTTYRVLVLPPRTTMRPAVLRKIRDLVRAGATVLGPLPTRSPSLAGYPQCDREVRTLADSLRTGDRRVIGDMDLRQLFTARKTAPDFESGRPLRYTHRRTANADIYFVANPEDEPVTTVASFRVGPKAPEQWDPKTAGITRPAVYDIVDGTVRLPLQLGPHGSTFVVFREAADPHRLVEVRRNGEALLGTQLPRTAKAGPALGKPGSFTLAAWIKPADATTLHAETNQGVRGLAEQRNDVIFPPHGGSFGSADAHAGAGLAVGRNGVCVFEHGANYFVPVLVHAASLTDWVHVTVAYENNRPRLFLNGEAVHTGMQSKRTVHPGMPGAAGGKPFRGDLGKIRKYERTLSDVEVSRLAETMRRPDEHRTDLYVSVTREKAGKNLLRAGQSGSYSLQTADGSMQSITVPELPAPVIVPGPWEVAFGPDPSVKFTELQDWKNHPDDAVRHFSGKATYRSDFDFGGTKTNLRWVLDLGELHDLAAVRLNDRDMGVLWIAPWRVDITDALKKGSNRVEIDVVNAWNNRLVGDAARAAKERRSYILAPTVKPSTGLQPAGLLGPVRITPIFQKP